MMQAGLSYELKIIRKTDLGYMLGEENDDVLLHFKEAHGEHNIGDTLHVFIYFDKKGRLCATENEPFVSLNKPGFAKVCDVISSIGVFVNIHTDVSYEINTYQEAYVYRIGEAGINCVTKDMVNVFVHKSMIRDTYHVGQMVVVKIVYKNASGYNGSFIEHKEKMIDSDREIILNYLTVNGGKMHIDAKSSSEEIEAKLHLSRKAFKRALGGLYKDHIVDFKDGYTIKIK